ncbi:MAG: hypothetical protein IJR85_06165 [Synergistaceae bacterium]|nr:hypothetical protein [Synergistaceae bacterium]
MYVGKSNDLAHRIKQHLADTVHESGIMHYFYFEGNNSFRDLYGEVLWDKKDQQYNSRKKIRADFKQKYFDDFLSKYHILVILINTLVPKPKRNIEDVALSLERALISLLNPKINIA